MMNDLFMHARKNGLVKLEADVEEPEKSALFSKYPSFIKDHHAVHSCATRCECPSRGASEPLNSTR